MTPFYSTALSVSRCELFLYLFYPNDDIGAHQNTLELIPIVYAMCVSLLSCQLSELMVTYHEGLSWEDLPSLFSLHLLAFAGPLNAYPTLEDI